MPADFDRCVKDVSSQLLKDNPKMKGKDSESRAFAMCTAQFKKAGKKTRDNLDSDKKLDEDGHIIVAENVPLVFTGVVQDNGNK